MQFIIHRRNRRYPVLVVLQYGCQEGRLCPYIWPYLDRNAIPCIEEAVRATRDVYEFVVVTDDHQIFAHLTQQVLGRLSRKAHQSVSSDNAYDVLAVDLVFTLRRPHTLHQRFDGYLGYPQGFFTQRFLLSVYPFP